VASSAGVDPILMHHYFGNNDGLLTATLAQTVDAALLLASLDAEPANAGGALVRRVLGAWESDP